MALKATEVVTGEARLSYVHLMQPYAYSDGADAKYSVTVLIPKTDAATKQRIDAAIEAAAQQGVAEKWGGKRPAIMPTPVHDGDGARPSDGEPFGQECKGHWVFTASTKNPIEVVDTSGNPIIDDTEVYSGMYGRVCVNFFTYNFNGKKGVGCGLGPVQKTRDGAPLGGHTSAAEAFGTPAAQPAAGGVDPITGQPISDIPF
ncbi:MAG: DUF2815 family protein [Eubacteriales bacterium]|nr:DUF2815 family protein [Eubacteriales bacterium]